MTCVAVTTALQAAAQAAAATAYAYSRTCRTATAIVSATVLSQTEHFVV